MVAESVESVVQGLTAFTAVAILVSGLDDMFIDVWYYAGEARRRLRPVGRRKYSEAELRALPEQAIAIMIPAWHEDAVIAHMLRNTLKTVEYANYDIFIGTYPNDEATMLAVASVAESEPRIHRIVTPNDGPTNKADCLNWIIAGIKRYDKEHSRDYKIYMLHDSEDLVHPLSFKLMNAHVPAHASMAQLPVVPFESPAKELTAGTYLDEFAESHLKDMVVRERLSGMVPSAGVGTGFSSAALDRLALKHNNQIFNVNTFTEDYDLAFRLNAIGEKSILLQYFVEKTRVSGRGLAIERELVGTREYFPDNFHDAVRQKARWTLGIVFHGWRERGWEGGPALRYMIWRDRKTLLTNSVNMLGYLLLLDGLASAYLGLHLTGEPFARIPEGSWVWNVIAVDGLLLFNRCVQRVVTIARVSNRRQAALSLPRIIWGNVINFFAVAKASWLFGRATLTGKQPVWAKTAHAFPTEEQLMGYKRKLGDLLLEARLLTLTHLTEALAKQKESGRLLGDILVDLGYVSEDDVVSVLGGQLKVDVLRLEAAAPGALALISEAAAREHLMIVADADSRPLLVAAADVGDKRMRTWLDANLPHPYRLALAGRRRVVDAIEKAAGRASAALAAPHPEARRDAPGLDLLQ
ncbi:MAG: glycosyl transferase family protein [Elusimicrobiota bacterium]|nr:MAG: glycosyl transferase family protein [Elusimicrobiota bacterium]